jgi:hypothetical protein
MRDDLESVLAGTVSMTKTSVSDNEVRTFDGVGAIPLTSGYDIEVLPQGDKIRVRFITGSSGKREVRLLIVKG